MTSYARLLTLLLGALVLSGCASTSTYVTTWKSPDAKPLEFRGHKVVAAVVVGADSRRRLAEDRLSQQIAALGAEARTMYSLLPSATVGDEKAIRTALEAADVKGLIVMQPVYVDRSVHITPGYEGHTSTTFWGGPYGSGFVTSYVSPTETKITETTVVYVETQVYSLEQNKLVWAGRSKSDDPDTVTELIEAITAATASELKKEGLIRQR